MLNQLALGSQNRGTSYGEKVNKYAKRLGSEKQTEKKDINRELYEHPEDLRDIQHSGSLQKKNEIIQRRISSNSQKNV